MRECVGVSGEFYFGVFNSRVRFARLIALRRFRGVVVLGGPIEPAILCEEARIGLVEIIRLRSAGIRTDDAGE